MILSRVDSPPAVLQLLCAFLLTATIGWEREWEAHSLGLRTFPLVGTASCAYMLLLGGKPGLDLQSHLLQGLIAGIGFIGGGAILKDGPVVKGAATAASVWSAGVIGAAVAVGHLGIALMLSLLNLVALRGLLPLKRWIDREASSRED